MPPKRMTTPSATPEQHAPETQPHQGQWSARERLSILAEYESYPRGDTRRGELLRRHGLYTSHMSKWREQRDRGALDNLAPRSLGRPKQVRDEQQDEVLRLQRENARLQAELHKAQTVIEIQKKVATLLGTTLPTPPSDEP